MVVFEPGQEFFYCGVQWVARERCLFERAEEIRPLVASGVLVPVWRLGESVGRA